MRFNFKHCKERLIDDFFFSQNIDLRASVKPHKHSRQRDCNTCAAQCVHHFQVLPSFDLKLPRSC